MSDPLTIGIVASIAAGANDQLREEVDALRDLGIEIDVWVSWEAAQNRELTRRFIEQDKGLIVAAGGDGTLNAVAEAVYQAGADIEIGGLAFGTANDFLTGLDQQNDRLSGILRRDAHDTDVGWVASHDRVFLNIATGGFGAEVTADTNPRLKSAFGGLAYVLSGIGRLADLEPFELELSSADFSWSGQTLGFAVGNGCQTGGGFRVCSAAAVDDGLLDVCIAPEAAANSFKAYVLDGLVQSEDVIYEQVESVEIRTSREVHVNLDGEPITGDHFVFEVEPRAISMRR
jgi:lipid kinase YegS